MSKIKSSVENWLNELNNFSYKNYEELPDLELYMDQVVGILEKQLYIFKTNSDDKLITPSMINNYVKGEVVPAPISKKYNREHLAIIEETMTLKQVLSIAETKQILDSTYTDTVEKCEVFNSFNKMYNEKIDSIVEEAFKKLNETDDENEDPNALNEIALEMAISASVYSVISKRILDYSAKYNTLANQENDKKKKKKKGADEEAPVEE